MEEAPRNFDHLLVERGLISAKQIDQLIGSIKGNPFIESTTKEMGAIKEDLVDFVAKHYKIPYADLNITPIDIALIDYIPYFYVDKYNIIPFKQERNTLHIAMENPLDRNAIEDIKSCFNVTVKPYLCHSGKIKRIIDIVYEKQYSKDIVRTPNHIGELTSSTSYKRPPAVRFFDNMLFQAIVDNASDIHIEPMVDNCRIRFRIDGELYPVIIIPHDIYISLMGRIKVLGNLDIAENRQPQDGRPIKSVDGEKIDIRISTIPTLYGEKIVLRLLNKSKYFLSKEKLGLTKKQMNLFKMLLKNPNGIVLATGPAGSGKTTTIYSILSELNKNNINIMTIEDPVEYTIPGINQTQVNNKIGFINGLKAILRQDPDTIMVGEIRDVDTANMAIHSAITGHLVFSTLHTNSAVGAITRLVDMGIERYLLSASIIGIISQRLVRILCPRCKKILELTPYERQLLNVIDPNHIANKIYAPIGCYYCNFMGYSGRRGVFELFIVDNSVRDAISKGVTERELMDLAVHSGMDFMQEQCVGLLADGITSMDEIMKIIYTNDLIYASGGGGC